MNFSVRNNMRNVLVAFFVFAAVLFVAAEARGRGKGGPGGKPWKNNIKGMKDSKCPRNCSDCEEGVCLACDEDFALKTVALGFKNKTICVRCGRRLKMMDPGLFLQQCIADCPRNCSICEDGSCKACDPGFFSVQTRILRQRTVCVPCGPRLKRNWPDVFVRECTESGCGRNCANCTTPGLCTLCEGDLKLYTPPGINITKCIRKCPPLYKREKGASPPRCEFHQKRKLSNKCGKKCEDCTEEGVCEKCFKPLLLVKLRDRTICLRQCPFHFRKYFDPETNTKICEQRGKPFKGRRKNPFKSDI